MRGNQVVREAEGGKGGRGLEGREGVGEEVREVVEGEEFQNLPNPVQIPGSADFV